MRALALSSETAKYMFEESPLSTQVHEFSRIIFSKFANSVRSASFTSFALRRSSVIIQLRIKRQAGQQVIVKPDETTRKAFIPQVRS